MVFFHPASLASSTPHDAVTSVNASSLRRQLSPQSCCGSKKERKSTPRRRTSTTKTAKKMSAAFSNLPFARHKKHRKSLGSKARDSLLLIRPTNNLTIIEDKSKKDGNSSATSAHSCSSGIPQEKVQQDATSKGPVQNQSCSNRENCVKNRRRVQKEEEAKKKERQ